MKKIIHLLFPTQQGSQRGSVSSVYLLYLCDITHHLFLSPFPLTVSGVHAWPCIINYFGSSG